MTLDLTWTDLQCVILSFPVKFILALGRFLYILTVGFRALIISLVSSQSHHFQFGFFYSVSTTHNYLQLCREDYAKMKAECSMMDDIVGSGEVVTSPRINEDGSPIEDIIGEQGSSLEEQKHLDNGTRF